jgi:hypothetical protein
MAWLTRSSHNGLRTAACGGDRCSPVTPQRADAEPPLPEAPRPGRVAIAFIASGDDCGSHPLSHGAVLRAIVAIEVNGRNCTAVLYPVADPFGDTYALGSAYPQ